MAGVKVGSAEEFQGQERRIILVSTVRSSVEYVGFDRDHKLGFLANPKRFNVVVTRAKALLIVIGNPYVLAGDPCWRALLAHCFRHGAYRGCDVSTLSLGCDPEASFMSDTKEVPVSPGDSDRANGRGESGGDEEIGGDGEGRTYQADGYRFDAVEEASRGGRDNGTVLGAALGHVSERTNQEGPHWPDHL